VNRARWRFTRPGPRAAYCPITSTVRCRSLESEFATRQLASAFFHQLLRPLDIGSGVDVQFRVRIESREPHLAVGPIQVPRVVASSSPRRIWRRRRCAEAEHESNL